MKRDPEVKSWEQQPYSIQNMAIDEEYGFGILNEGQAIAVARSVKVRPNEFVMPARTVFNLSEQGSTYEDVDSVAVTGANPLDPNSQSVQCVVSASRFRRNQGFLSPRRFATIRIRCRAVPPQPA